MDALAGSSEGSDSRELDRLEMLLEQIKAIEDELTAARCGATTVSPVPRMLIELKGIGRIRRSALDGGLYRRFDNRRQVAAYAGLAPTPWQSGSIDREQGVSKAGNPRLRTTLLQLAWLWLRHQPNRRWPNGSWIASSATGAAKEDNDRCPCSQASRRPLEVCHLRSRHRGRDM